jgi:hypothetical protein
MRSFWRSKPLFSPLDIALKDVRLPPQDLGEALGQAWLQQELREPEEDLAVLKGQLVPYSQP